jgi:hypothetical protein
MEVVLLWLDDLDDLLFSVALLWERLRRAILQVGLAAAFSLAASERLGVLEDLAALFVYLSAASVAAWSLGAALRVYYYRARLAAA